MQGEIIGEDEVDIGTKIIDNNGIEHQIEMHKESGEVYAHEQDGYPDYPSERTDGENRHIEEAVRYAQYYVATEREYETMPPGTNPDRLTFVLFVVADLTTEQIKTYFGDLYQQVRSHNTGEQPVITFPSEIPDNAAIIYLQDIYLGLNAADRETLASAADSESFMSYVEEAVKSEAGKTLEELEEIATEHGVHESAFGEFDAERWIETVTGPHVRWHDNEGAHEHRYGSPDLGRHPDGIFHIVPHTPDSIQEFQEFLIHHLRCQIRDAYIAMGVTPPQEAQVTGPGHATQTAFYQTNPTYQNYHEPDATVNWNEITGSY